MIFTGIILLLGNIIIYITPLLGIYWIAHILYNFLLGLFGLYPEGKKRKIQKAPKSKHSIKKMIKDRKYKNVYKAVRKCNYP